VAKIKHTKNELKRQKDNLGRFRRFLPTLALKKQQLQLEIRRLRADGKEKASALESAKSIVSTWMGVLGEDAGIEKLIRMGAIRTGEGNIAGVDIPVFEGVDFEEAGYDLFEKPLWVDAAIEQIKDLSKLLAEIQILEQAIALLREELRITTQRVNLFEKVKIPEALENIRVINIFLGDEQTAAVVRGKIAKNKIERQAS
jgi:V/A-type H+-transporting ATPase subunit D